MKEPLILECSEQLATMLDGLVATGMFGPSRETAAQRCLELKVFEIMQAYTAPHK